MGDEDETVAEMEELILPATLDRLHATPNGQRGHRGRKTALERGVKGAQRGDPFSGCGGGELLRGVFDFGELWHAYDVVR
jgi:hypothetical protein